MKKFMAFEVDMSDNAVITAENIVHMGEIFALCALKNRISRSDVSLDGLYQGLVHDVYRKADDLEPFTDGYDIASTAIAFLCPYIGKRLGDIIPDRYSKPAKIRLCCTRFVDSYIHREYIRTVKTSVSMDDKVVKDKTSDMDCYISTEEEYAEVDDKISAMKLTKVENDVLDGYMAGLGITEIAKNLNVNLVTVWYRRKRIAKKYTNAFC